MCMHARNSAREGSKPHLSLPDMKTDRYPWSFGDWMGGNGCRGIARAMQIQFLAFFPTFCSLTSAQSLTDWEADHVHNALHSLNHLPTPYVCICPDACCLDILLSAHTIFQCCKQSAAIFLCKHSTSMHKTGKGRGKDRISIHTAWNHCLAVCWQSLQCFVSTCKTSSWVLFSPGSECPKVTQKSWKNQSTLTKWWTCFLCSTFSKKKKKKRVLTTKLHYESLMCGYINVSGY